MRKREFGDYIQDILDSIDAIEEFVRDQLRKTAERCVWISKGKYEVRRVFLIGSLVKGLIHERSDIDLVVKGLSPNLHMKALTDLWDLLPVGVELNLIPYKDAFEGLKEKAINEGELMYG